MVPEGVAGWRASGGGCDSCSNLLKPIFEARDWSLLEREGPRVTPLEPTPPPLPDSSHEGWNRRQQAEARNRVFIRVNRSIYPEKSEMSIS